jgi:hypothetical protein
MKPACEFASLPIVAEHARLKFLMDHLTGFISNLLCFI